MRVFVGGLAFLVLAACASGVDAPAARAAAQASAPAASYDAALSDARRPQADRDRDAARHPGDILAFAGVAPGQRIADIGPGAGYYTRLFAVAVGDAGRVYAIDRPNAPDRPPRAILAVAPDYANVTVVQQGYQGWRVDEPLDAIFISQIYHDFHLPQLNLDWQQVNRDMFAALKPGGTLIIIDHAAVDGSDLSVTETLHRIDQATVVRELQAAGFVLEAESQVLRNPADNRTERVFESDIRGHTDQFVLRFRKPA
ncbi:MAG: methyltransferase domain-containing protein [Hyphomonadaceae bacterium]|nr:methyltransferase domain-containing protein [Hyphomonadaceae bacterium]